MYHNRIVIAFTSIIIGLAFASDDSFGKTGKMTKFLS